MQTIDEILAKFREETSCIDEVTLTVLKGHLVIEQMLDAAIGCWIPYMDRMPDLTFHRKVELCTALGVHQGSRQEWSMVFALNQLRNKLAHSLSGEAHDAKIKNLREKCSVDQIFGAQDLDDVQMCQWAVTVCIAFLHDVFGEIKEMEENAGFRKLLPEIERMSTQ